MGYNVLKTSELVILQTLEQWPDLGHQISKVVEFRCQSLISAFNIILICLVKEVIVDATKLVFLIYRRKEPDVLHICEALSIEIC